MSKFIIGDRVMVRQDASSLPYGYRDEVLSFPPDMEKLKGREFTIEDIYFSDGLERIALENSDWTFHESWLDLVEQVTPDYAYKYFDLEEEYNMLEDDFHELQNQYCDLSDDMYKLRNEYSDMKLKLSEVIEVRDETRDALIEKWTKLYDGVVKLYTEGK